MTTPDDMRERLDQIKRSIAPDGSVFITSDETRWLIERLKAAQAECERLNAMIENDSGSWPEVFAIQDDEIRKLRAQLAACREALKPFVEHAPTQPYGNAMTLENINRAAAALAGMEEWDGS